MPRLDGDMENFRMGGNFDFTGARMEQLGASEYTLVTIAVDETGSVNGFEDQLRDMLVAAVESCKSSDRAENLLVRVIKFGTQYPQGVDEVHGFKALADIDVADYERLRPGHMTPLYDAAYSSVGAMNSYGEQLAEEAYMANAICFIITDGADNRSVTTPTMLKEELRKGVSGEYLESMISILVGVNAQQYQRELEDFQQAVGIDHYKDAGDANSRNLAKLADFVSTSIQSQSQSLGTGGPSQNIPPTI